MPVKSEKRTMTRTLAAENSFARVMRACTGSQVKLPSTMMPLACTARA